VLDEPTIGLDLIYRRQFYDTLLNDYFDHERTILLTTHQVEEVENLLTDVLFVDRGHIVLDASVEAIAERYTQVNVASDQIEAARALHPFYERQIFGRPTMLFEGQTREALSGLGELRTPGIADLFVAKVQTEAA
jgi:ABC-2 type transport system ATP-binding protein